MVVESSGPSASQVAGYTAIGATVGIVGLVALGAAIKACKSYRKGQNDVDDQYRSLL